MRCYGWVSGISAGDGRRWLVELGSDLEFGCRSEGEENLLLVANALVVASMVCVGCLTVLSKPNCESERALCMCFDGQ